MSERAPDGLYVYQPKPPQPDGRIYAIGGLPLGARCDGLTREEAHAVLATLQALPAEARLRAELQRTEQARVDSLVRHRTEIGHIYDAWQRIGDEIRRMKDGQ
jgi:hypothetical protein